MVDVGCGKGYWLKAFKDNGAKYLLGIDGYWNNQKNMIDQDIKFYSVDLNKPMIDFDNEKYELAISLEVAEHLEASSSINFIEFLIQLSEVVLFGAAYTGQGGTNHINEKPHTYWASIFQSYNYIPYDLFRPKFWGNNDIPFWYKQNTFLYVKKSSSLTRVLENLGLYPIENIAFMDCIHPSLYNNKLLFTNQNQSIIKQIIRKIIPKKTILYFKKWI